MGRGRLPPAKTLKVPENITVVELPPYSPELNPIENLWRHLKSHYWSNRSHTDHDALEQAAIDAWRLAPFATKNSSSPSAPLPTPNALIQIRARITAEYRAKRRMLEIVGWNYRLVDASLVPEWRKPFDVLAERPLSENKSGQRDAS